MTATLVPWNEPKYMYCWESCSRTQPSTSGCVGVCVCVGGGGGGGLVLISLSRVLSTLPPDHCITLYNTYCTNTVLLFNNALWFSWLLLTKFEASLKLFENETSDSFK